MADPHGYSKEHPPINCMECDWHIRTYSPATGCRMYWSDNCGLIKKAFAKMHIILRGEYRDLSNHDEEDLITSSVLPYECPYFNSMRAFWESYGRIRMDWEIFRNDCWDHPDTWRGYFVYSLKENLDKIRSSVSPELYLQYLMVVDYDITWFEQTFGGRAVVLSNISPDTWSYNPPK